jgi:hypothetical protein
MGLQVIAYDNRIARTGTTSFGARVVDSFYGASIKGDHNYQLAKWLQWAQLVDVRV